MTPTQAVLTGNALDAVWPTIDPQGRTFRMALVDARNRAIASNWVAGDIHAYADAKALAIGTSIWASVLQGRTGDPYSDRWATALLTTDKIIAEKAGYKGESAAEIKSKPSMVAALPIIEIVILLVGAALIAFWIYSVTNIVDNELARNAQERNLLRIHAEAEKIIGQHLANEAKAGHQIDWSDAEIDYLHALEDAQRKIIAGTGPQPSVWSTPWPYLGIGAAALVVVAVVYKDEIKRALAPSPHRRLAA